MDMTLTLAENDRGHPSVSASQYLLSRSVGLISSRIRRTGQLAQICLRFCLLQTCKQISNAKMKGLSSDSCSGSRWSLLSWDNSNIPGLSRPRRSVMIPLILISSKRLFYLPYPHTDNVKQWQTSRVHKIFGYYQFDDILYEYIYLKTLYERREKANVK